MRNRALWFLAAFLLLALSPASAGSRVTDKTSRAFRKPAENGWIMIHLEGKPSEIGFQHGSLLAPEIEDAFAAIKLSITHGSKDWAFFRKAAEHVLWPKVEAEYREELQGIQKGLASKGSKLDLWDVVAMNAWLELDPYYTRHFDSLSAAKDSAKTAAKDPAKKDAKPRPTGDHCSAFVATGSHTKDGKVVIGHNNWSDYITGTRWNIIFDITPARGHHLLMDGMPGLIHSGDDFGINSAGIMITETTISQFVGFDPSGVPEFVRARKAMQYSASIDDFARIMKAGNNGGYANTWLVADRKTNEIGKLELGLKHVTLERKKDGYFIGSNFPENPALAKDETEFDTRDMSLSPNARRLRWTTLMGENIGRVDVALGQKFLADHFDTFENKEEPSERTLCGHIEDSKRGSKPWQPAYGTAGAVQSKVTDATMAAAMSLTAALGHSCGRDFKAAAHLAAHPEFEWQRPALRDMDSRPWTTFQAAHR